MPPNTDATITWISSETRPDSDRTVLTCDIEMRSEIVSRGIIDVVACRVSNEVWESYWDWNNGCWRAIHPRDNWKHVTHWAEMPTEPPPETKP